ncbi:plasmid recombination protein [Ideonella sp. 4Y16]|uniref:plasmid recombination protein n=1 Tax=Ideonella alba TaxID=2824118 RepID=UPI001B35FCFA|nr:plasmid recombination protein [Ideonella alba]MBQ0944113.1 plasmid recombination protein [Ideonella alba]
MSAAAFMRAKKLAANGHVLAAARHNRRTIAAERGAGSNIDPTRSHLNVTLEGPKSPEGVAALERWLVAEAGITKVRRDAVRAIEVICSLPRGAPVDALAYFASCVEWSRGTFGPVLSADIHHDEAAPHVHVLCLPLVDGRLRGSDLMGGRERLRHLQSNFFDKVAKPFGLKRGLGPLKGKPKASAAAAVIASLHADGDPALRSLLWPLLRDTIERDPRPFADALGFAVEDFKADTPGKFAHIMTSRGKGAKTHAEEARRNRALIHSRPIGVAGPRGGLPDREP